jgi:hypothetical protein
MAIDYRKSEKYQRATEKHLAAYRRLNITPEIERAVVLYLADLGVLDYCAGSGTCDGPCPSGQSCIQTISTTCVCSNDSFWTSK